MKYITQLSLLEQRQLIQALNAQIYAETVLINSIADKFEIDRNELFDFYILRLRGFLDKNDMTDKKFKTLDLARVLKAIKRGG